MTVPSTPDRAAVIANAIVQVIFTSPRNLRAQIEALLRDEIDDLRRELIHEIHMHCE
jgi:hypothetical protein